MSRSNNTQTSRAIARIASLMFSVRRMMRRHLADGGLKIDPSAWMRLETLRFIAEADGPSMSAIADFLSIAPASATSLVNSLSRGGLIERRTNLADKRALRIRLSPTGQDLLREAKGHQERALAQVFAPLSERDLAAFERMLARVLSSNGG